MRSGEWKHATWLSIAIFVPILVIAFTQGGTLSEMRGDTGVGAFTWNLTGRIFHDSDTANDSIALWDLRFFREYGLHVALLIIASIYFWKKRRESAFPLLLCIIAAAHFLAPLIITYKPSLWNMLRFFHVFFSLSSLLIAIFIWENMLPHRRLRWIGAAMIALMLVAGTLNVLVRLTFPTLRFESTDLFPSMPKVSPAQTEMHRWVKENTTLDDWFFVYSDEDNEKVTVRDRLLFSTYAGRFVVGWGNHSEPAPDKTAHIRAIVDSCADESLDALSIRFIVVPTGRQVEWFETKCDHEKWVPVYASGEKYPVVYGIGEVGK